MTKGTKPTTTCRICGLDMTKSDGCVPTPFAYSDGTTMSQVPHSRKRRCGDCGATQGGYHHAGCRMEKCPRCGKVHAADCECDREFLDAKAREAGFASFSEMRPDAPARVLAEAELLRIKEEALARAGHKRKENDMKAKTKRRRGPPKKRTAAKKSKNPKGPTIRATAESLLQNPDLSYVEILDRVHREHAGCKTTYACLRWYATKMRERGVELPERPASPERRARAKEREREESNRAKSKKPAKGRTGQAKKKSTRSRPGARKPKGGKR